MRFLLHPSVNRGVIRQHGRRTTKNIGNSTSINRMKGRVSPAPVVTSKSVGASSEENSQVQSWGQQCSPNCGCVVRFEATTNSNNGKILSASYHAKSVILSKTDSGETVPAMTLRNNRPMFQPCNCSSLHQLATQVVDYLPTKKLVNIGSSMEFTGTRASPAFRHTVLEKQGLSTTDTHCFDLVEEALTAMIKGHLLKSRPQISLRDVYAKVMSDQNQHQPQQVQRGTAVSEEESKKEDQYSFRIDMSHFSHMSALQLLDMQAHNYYLPFGSSFDRENNSNHHHSEFLQRLEKKEGISRNQQEGSSSKSLDWVAYVDEQEAQIDERQHRQQSA